MKRIRLSAMADRILACSVFLFIAALFSMLLYALRGAGTAFTVTLGASIFLLLLLGTYVLSVLRSVCVISPDTRTVEIRGLRRYRPDITTATGVTSQPFQMGSSESRRIVFLDDQGAAVTAFATSFFLAQGVQAEPAASRIAQALGLAYVPSLEPWQYDRAARRARRAGATKQEKGAAEPVAQNHDSFPEGEMINYDELDELRKG